MDRRNIKPNLFIVGAARSGTTSLWQCLKQHPMIFMPEDEIYKEPAYFSIKGRDLGYKRYIDIFQSAKKNHKYIGEASTAYLTDPTSSKNIYEFNPNAKIIILLRNPVNRAYSLYNWMVQEGYEYSESFEKSLKLENERINKKIPNWFEPEYYWNYLYFRSGLYYEQVKRYIEMFRENVIITKLSDIKNNFYVEYNKICSFLNLMPNKIYPDIHNKSHQVYSAKIQFILRKITNEIIGEKLFLQKNIKFELKFQLVKIIINKFFNNYMKLYRGKKKLIDPSKTLLTFIRIIRLINKKDINFNDGYTKKQRDVLLASGLKNNMPNLLDDNLRSKLLSMYEDNIIKLEKLLNTELQGWLT